MTKVLCGAPCGKHPVYGRFHDCFAAVDLPEGSVRTRVAGGSIPLNLNKLVDEAVGERCTHLFVVEDDAEFAPDTVTRLLAHDKPVVAGLCRTRYAPFRPYIYKGQDQTGLRDYTLTPEDRGLIGGAGYATGMSGILIDMDVFNVLKRPYFHHYFVGEEEWGQDIVFGKALMDAGIEVYCDLTVTIGHCTQCVIGSRIDADGIKPTVRVTGIEIVL